MLNVVVFSCGAALMGLELVAARVLAPFLGNSIYVWGSVISVVMIALSLGYWAGGQIADRFGAARALPPVIGSAGLATAFAPLLAKAVLPSVSELGPRLGSLAAAALIFFLPAILLAMVSPLGVRLAANRGITHLGRSAGSLYAISTAGSIAGTLATSFWLIPLLSIEPLIVWTGFVLAATALLALGLPGGEQESMANPLATQVAGSAAVLLVAASLVVGGYVLWRVAPAPSVNEAGEAVLFRADTEYHRITVTEDDTTRHLRFDASHQTAIDLDDPYVSRIRYPDYMHLALALNPDAKRVLVLGLGGGAITKRFWRDYPELSVDSVEIDKVVVDVSRRYFAITEDERSRIFVDDARRYVQHTTETYDIIIVDAYYSDSLPFHLTTQEFLGELKECMNPDGVIAYNVISSAEGSGSDLFRSMYRTAGTVWDRLWVFPIGLGEEGTPGARRNIIVLATDALVAEEEFRGRIADRVGGRVTIEGFPEMAADLYGDPVRAADVPLLTDAHAPVDSLIRVND
ncbi:MAG: spermidine synthase [Coriobacteriia bacterium]